MLKANRLLNVVLAIVSSESDVQPHKILSRCSETEVVDSRWICVKLLNGYGCYPSKIADLMSITPRYVQYILTDFDDRIALNIAMRNNYERAKKRLRIISE